MINRKMVAEILKENKNEEVLETLDIITISAIKKDYDNFQKAASKMNIIYNENFYKNENVEEDIRQFLNKSA